MHLKLPETTASGAPFDLKGAPKLSSSLPLGHHVSLSSIAGPTYVTAQLLVQQVAYQLSDKIFSYSPDTFDLDLAVRDWSAKKEANIRGEPTIVVPLQTRTGAGAFALGYIFSSDFDMAKRAVPQTLLAASLSLQMLRSAFDQLSLLYGMSSPLVAHVAAADYSAQDGLFTEYHTALDLAEDLGLGLVVSASAYETQHMSLLATLMAAILPTVHIYDGLRTSRETLRVVDALSQTGVAGLYDKVAGEVASVNKRLDTAGKVLELLRIFNCELGTEYQPFEYHGHLAAETVFVVFGSVEAQSTKQLVEHWVAKGEKAGVVNVRLYRPFVEDVFLETLPNSVQTVVVLGQVRDRAAAEDASVQSALFADVLTAVYLSGKWEHEPSVTDQKYAATETLTPISVASLLLKATHKDAQVREASNLQLLESVQQYSFWDVDKLEVADAAYALGAFLSSVSTSNIYVYDAHDNLVLGGLVRTDIRVSRKAIEAPYAVEQADVAFVGDEKLLSAIAILDSVKAGGTVLIRLPAFKKDDLEKRIPAACRRAIREKALALRVIDTSYYPALEKEAKLLVELAFLRVAQPMTADQTTTNLASIEPDAILLRECWDALTKCLHEIEVPAAWADAEVDATDVSSIKVKDLRFNSLVPFAKTEAEEDLHLHDWQSAAKGLVFKEAYGTQNTLRPDLTVETHTITVKENRRLTPPTYDRNIFHIEFDLGDSGLTYEIGEALGIHADNDPEKIDHFIASYGLDPEALVQLPCCREPADQVEIRTVYQSLVRNIDIFGKPPKRFFQSLAEFATDEKEREKLLHLGSKEGAEAYKQVSEVETVTYADVLAEYPSARPSFHDLARIISPLKRREYSIASAQAVTPTSVALMIVVVDWVDTRGRTRYGQATRYLSSLLPGTAVVASVKPSVMKLPALTTGPLIMAGLGTGLAPFRAFVQYRAMQKAQGQDIGAILLYLGSRHQREEYLYGEEWEAYVDAGVITLLGAAFSRDQPRKIYIQDRMRETLGQIGQAYVNEKGSFYLCGPTWPVPDVTAVLEEVISAEAQKAGKKVDARKVIQRLKDEGRYVLEVY